MVGVSRGVSAHGRGSGDGEAAARVLPVQRRADEVFVHADALSGFASFPRPPGGKSRALGVGDGRAQRAFFFFNITHELRTPLNSIIGFNTLAVETGELTEFTGSFIKASLTSARASASSTRFWISPNLKAPRRRQRRHRALLGRLHRQAAHRTGHGHDPEGVESRRGPRRRRA